MQHDVASGRFAIQLDTSAQRVLVRMANLSLLEVDGVDAKQGRSRGLEAKQGANAQAQAVAAAEEEEEEEIFMM